MTLSEIANSICGKLHDTETASVTACKDYIKERYQMVWDLALWTESLGIVSQDVKASTPEVTISSDPSIFYYPTSSTVASTAPRMDFVVAVKFTKTGDTDGNELVGSEWVRFFALDANVWNNVETRRSSPTNFIPLPKDSSGNTRIKLVPAPKDAGTLYALGKMKLPDLGDSDSPVLPGIDQVLLAFGMGDMLERSMQFGKAQAKYTEANALMQGMRDLQKNQQQQSAAVVPLVQDEWSGGDFV